MAPTPRPRSSAQVLASRANGAKGRGPRTPEGLRASSANSSRHGLYSKVLLGPGLDVETVRAAYDDWLATSGADGLAASQLAARGAVATVQLDRVDAIREKVLSEILEDRVAQSSPAKDLQRTRKIRGDIAALAELAAEIRAPVRRDHAAQLLPPLRNLAMDLLGVQSAAAGSYAIAGCIAVIEGDSLDDVPADLFGAVAENCREILKALDGEIAEMVAKVEVERVRQQELLLIADDRRLREVHKVRGRLVREIESVARALGALKDLEMKGDRSPVLARALPPVEFRIVGGP